MSTVLDSPTPEGRKIELTDVGYIPKWFTCPQTVAHLGSNRSIATRPIMNQTHDLLMVSPTYCYCSCSSHLVATNLLVRWSVRKPVRRLASQNLRSHSAQLVRRPAESIAGPDSVCPSSACCWKLSHWSAAGRRWVWPVNRALAYPPWTRPQTPRDRWRHNSYVTNTCDRLITWTDNNYNDLSVIDKP